MANFRGTKDSISSVAETLLQQATTSNSRSNDCPKGCQTRDSEIIYRVAPIAFQPHSNQRPECLKLEQQTTVTPFEFSEKTFATLDDLNRWIMDFSRGKGAEGKKLYRLCSSNCSPRYTFHIRGSDIGHYRIAAKVLCGLARDRSNKQYALSTALKLNCVNPPN